MAVTIAVTSATQHKTLKKLKHTLSRALSSWCLVVNPPIAILGGIFLTTTYKSIVRFGKRKSPDRKS